MYHVSHPNQNHQNSLTYPFQLLEVLPQERDGIVGPGHAQLHDAILEHPLDPVRLDVRLALA